MKDSIKIKSSGNDYELELSNPRPPGLNYPVEYIQVSIKGHDIAASSSDVYLYQPHDLARFFDEVAADCNGRDGEKEWASIEDDFCLVCKSDRIGHIEFKVTLKSGPYAEDWKMEIIIHVDARQIEEIAKQVREFLHLN